MARLLKILLALAVLGFVAYAAFRYYLPSTIAESLKSGQNSSLVPDEIQQKVAAFKLEVASDVGDLPVYMFESNIDFSDLRTMLDRLDPGEVSDAILEMSSVSITSAEQAFDIVEKHVNIEGYDLEVFRDVFVQNSDTEDIRRAMETVRQYDYLITMSMPIAKEVALDLLESSRQEIEKQLLVLESNQ